MKLILLLAMIFTTETLGQVTDGQPANAAVTNAAFMGRLGDTSTIGNITVNSEKEVRFEDSGSNFMGFKAPSTVTSSTTFTWPDGDGLATNYVMITDGAGTLSWVERFTKFLTDGQIFVGDVSDVPTGVTPSGELTMSNAGAFVLDNNSVIAKSLTGFSSGAGTITSADTLLSSIEKLDGNIDLKLDETLNDTNIFVGNGSNVAIGVSMSSEASIDNTGAVTLDNDSVIGKLLTGFTPGAGTVAATDTILEAIQKLDGNDVSALSAALTSGNIFVGNGSNLATGVSMSGEASIDNTGSVTIANSAVIGKVLTGFSSGAGTIAAADTILEAFQKADGNTAAKQDTVSGTTDEISFSANTIGIADNPIFPGTGSITVAIGTTAQQPTPVDGMVRYSSDDNEFQFREDGAWVGLGGTIPFDFDTKVLSSDVTSDGTMSDLTFISLDIGEFYEVKLKTSLLVNFGASDPSIEVAIVHDSVTIATSAYTQNGNVSSVVNSGTSVIFEATATTLTFSAASASANSFVGGNGARTATFVQLREVKGAATTTKWD